MQYLLHRVAKYLCILVVWSALSPQAGAHGLPIFVSVNPVTNQVEVSASFDDAVVDGAFISDLPGFGVLNSFAGVAPGTTISLRMPQDLLFTNSEVLQPTTSSVSVISAEFVQQMVVDSSSGFQEYLDWAVYPNGAGVGWDADGLYLLGPGTPAAGVYGIVVQVSLPGAIDSEPFLISVVHNPVDLTQAKATLTAAIELPPQADFTRDWRVGSADLTQWETNYGLAESTVVAKVLGDADNDLDVDGLDFLQWQLHAGSQPAAVVSSVSVPEPSSVWLFVLATLTCRRNRHPPFR